MKKLIFLLSFVCFYAVASAQIFTKPNNLFGVISNRQEIDSTLYFPTGCGVPSGTTSLRSVGFGAGQIMKMSAFYYDSCGHKLWVYDPSSSSWAGFSSGVIDTTSLSNRINTKLGWADTTNMLLPYSRIINTVVNLGGAPSFQEDVAANRPLPGNVGSLFLAVDTKLLYFDNGSSWSLVGSGGGGSGVTPSNIIKQYFNGFANFVNLLSDSVTEGTINLYFSTARARAALLNAGSGLRIWSPQIPGLRSLVGGLWVKIDSTTTSNSLTFFVDTAASSAYYFRRTDQIPSGNLPATQVNAGRGTSATTIGGNPTFVWGMVNGQEPDSIMRIWTGGFDIIFDTLGTHFYLKQLANASTGAGDSSLFRHSNGQVFVGPIPSGGGGSGLTAIANRNMLMNNTGSSAVPSAALMPIYYADQWAGITPGNIVDCRVGINNLIDTVQKYGGGIIQFGAGIYKTTGTLVIPNGPSVMIQGSGGPDFQSTPGFGLTKSYGATVINNANQTDTALWILANGSWVRDITIMDTIAGLTSSNVGIACDSSYTSGVRNVAVENFNIGIAAHGGQFFHLDQCYSVDAHQYSYYLQSYPGLDAGSFHVTECYDFQVTSGASTHAIGLYAPNGGGLVVNGCFFGGDSIGIDLPWKGFSDVFITNTNFEFCSTKAINIDVVSGSSGLAHMIITGNEMWPGSGYHHGICIYDTAVGVSAARNIIINHNIFDQADTAILLRGNINYSVVGAENSFNYQVFTPIAVLNPPGGPITIPVTVNFAQNVQQLTESGGHIHFDPNFGSNGQVTLTFSDTLDIVNATYGGNFTINVTQGSGNYHLICGANVFNNVQAHTGTIWIDPTNGHITHITSMGNGFASGAIITNIQRYFPTNSIMYTDANNAVNDIAPGTNGNLLQMVSGVPTWTNVMTAAGQMLYGGTSGVPTATATPAHAQMHPVWDGVNVVWRDSTAGGGGGGGAPFLDNAALVENSSDNTKQLIFSAAGLTTGTTRTITLPDANITVAGTNFANSFSQTQTITGTTTNTTSDGLILGTTSIATVGAPKWSKALHLPASAWNAGTGTAQVVDWWIGNHTTSGAAPANGNLVFSAAVNGGAETPWFIMQSNGFLGLGGEAAIATPLDVNFASTSLGPIFRSSSSGNYGTMIPESSTTVYLGFNSGSNSSNGIHYNQAGQVGLGTPTLSSRFTMYGAGGTYSIPNNGLDGVALNGANWTYNDNGTAANTILSQTAINATGIATVTATNVNVWMRNIYGHLFKGDPIASTNVTKDHCWAVGMAGGHALWTGQSIFQSDGTTKPIAIIRFDSAHAVNFDVNSSANFDISGFTQLTLPSSGFGTTISPSDSVFVLHNVSGKETASMAPYIPNPTIYSQTADGTIANSASNLTTLGTGIGSNVIAANTLVSGKSITIRGSGVISTAASAPTVGLTFSNTSSSVTSGGINGITTSMTNVPIQWEYTGVVRGAGSTANIALFGWVDVNGTKTYTPFGSTYAFDTTISQTFDVKLQFGTASSSNTFTSNINLIRVQ